jgi:hypothetical protein
VGFISWTVLGGDSSMNEVPSRRVGGRMIRSRGMPSCVYTERGLYRACGRALRECSAPSAPPWRDHSALAEDAVRGLIMYGAWG